MATRPAEQRDNIDASAQSNDELRKLIDTAKADYPTFTKVQLYKACVQAFLALPQPARDALMLGREVSLDK